MSDPIEAQRIAMREALYDVATGSTQAMPDNDGDRLIVVPTRRLRPVGARLELTAERDKAQAPRGARYPRAKWSLFDQPRLPDPIASCRAVVSCPHRLAARCSAWPPTGRSWRCR